MADQTPARVIPRRRRHALRRLAVVLAPLIVLVSPTAASARPSAPAPVSGADAAPAAGWDLNGLRCTTRASAWGSRPWGDGILAIGGFDSDELFDVVESREVSGPGDWRTIAPLNTARTNLGTATLDGIVYAVGGYDDTSTLDVVETFDPRTGSWSRSPHLPQPRGGNGSRRAGRSAVRGRRLHLGPRHRGDHRVGHRVRPSATDLAVRRPDAHRPRAAAAGDGRPVSLRSWRALPRRQLADHHRALRPQVEQMADRLADARVACRSGHYNDEHRRPAGPGSGGWRHLAGLRDTRISPDHRDLRPGDRPLAGPSRRAPGTARSLGCATEADGTAPAIGGGSFAGPIAEVLALKLTRLDLAGQ